MSGELPTGAGATGAAATAAGAAAVATLTGACCTAPPVAALTVSLLGASGAAWAAGFAAFSPWLLLGSIPVLGYGFWSVRRATRSCHHAGAGAPRSVRFARWALAVASALWVTSVALRLFAR